MQRLHTVALSFSLPGAAVRGVFLFVCYILNVEWIHELPKNMYPYKLACWPLLINYVCVSLYLWNYYVHGWHVHKNDILT